jgi:hypothetical protein
MNHRTGPGFAPNPPHETANDFDLIANLTMTAEEGSYRYTIKAMHTTLTSIEAN